MKFRLPTKFEGKRIVTKAHAVVEDDTKPVIIDLNRLKTFSTFFIEGSKYIYSVEKSQYERFQDISKSILDEKAINFAKVSEIANVSNEVTSSIKQSEINNSAISEFVVDLKSPDGELKLITPIGIDSIINTKPTFSIPSKMTIADSKFIKDKDSMYIEKPLNSGADKDGIYVEKKENNVFNTKNLNLDGINNVVDFDKLDLDKFNSEILFSFYTDHYYRYILANTKTFYADAVPVYNYVYSASQLESNTEVNINNFYHFMLYVQKSLFSKNNIPFKSINKDLFKEQFELPFDINEELVGPKNPLENIGSSASKDTGYEIKPKLTLNQNLFLNTLNVNSKNLIKNKNISSRELFIFEQTKQKTKEKTPLQTFIIDSFFLDNLEDYNKNKMFLPIYIELNLNINNVSDYISKLLKDNDLLDSLLYFSIINEDKSEKKEFVDFYSKDNFRNIDKMFLDVGEWFNEVEEPDFDFEKHNLISDNYTKFKKFDSVPKKILFNKKVKNFFDLKLRTKNEIFKQDLSYSEIIFFHIDKIKNGEILQRIYVPNTLDKEFNYIDSQVNYDTNYTYEVYTHTLVIGNKFNDVRNNKSIHIITDLVKTISNISIFDNPPFKPNVDFKTFKGSDTKIKFTLSPNYGEYIIKDITAEDYDLNNSNLTNDEFEIDTDNIYDKIKQYQNKYLDLKEDEMLFETDDSLQSYIIFRYDKQNKEPLNYKEFSIYNQLSLDKGTSKAFIDVIEPNKTYYYCFRIMDITNKLSPYSEIYKVSLISEANGIYPTMSLFEFKENYNSQSKTKFNEKIALFMHDDFYFKTIDEGGEKLKKGLQKKEFMLKIKSLSSNKELNIEFKFGKEEDVEKERIIRS